MNSKIADFIIDEAYEDCNVVPMVCILTGKPVYGLYMDHYNYLGLHMMDSNDCLEHPDFRKNLQVILKRFYEDMKEVPPGIKGGAIHLNSYELWKFISMYLEGAFETYELLYMPTIHCDYQTFHFIDLMREGCTNQIGSQAKNLVFNHYMFDTAKREKTIMVYYRLIQALIFLKQGEFVWNIDELFNFVSGKINAGAEILYAYNRPEIQNQTLTSKEITNSGKEIKVLVDEVDRAMVATGLPDKCPKDVLQAILHRVKMTRLQWV